MKLTQLDKRKVHDKCMCGDYEILNFSCYVDGIYSYSVELTNDIKLEVNIIPFDNLQCFLSEEELGKLLDIDCLFFDCNIYTSNPETWETKKEEILLINIDKNNLN